MRNNIARVTTAAAMMVGIAFTGISAADARPVNDHPIYCAPGTHLVGATCVPDKRKGIWHS